MLSHPDAAALVAGSRLFDEEWYATLVGERFASRADAVERWLADPADDAPHPLFEPVWLYPRAKWRKHAPDPLSFYLSRPEEQEASPHPLFPVELGPLPEWLASHDPAELLSPPAAAATERLVVEVTGADLRATVRWLRFAERTGAGGSATLGSPAAQRVADAVVATLPRVEVPEVVITVDHGVEPPTWPWLPLLLEALDGPGVASAQPLLLDDDFTIAAPVLAGHPVSAVEHLDGTELARRFPGLEAVRAGATGRRVLATASWLPGPAAEVPELAGPARAVSVVEGIPSLSWAIDIAAGAGPIGRRWGDWHFASSLADSLRRLGQWVEIDHPETRRRATRVEIDVVLTLRGVDRVAPQPGAVNLLWVISHPDDVTPDELAEFDVAWAAGIAWAERHGVTPLLQCTDTTRFHPGVGTADPAGTALFVGNARGGARPVVTAALEAGVPLTVIGTGWRAHGIDVAAQRIANHDLPSAYATAGVVLNDHHDDMREQGFVSNRVFDVLAVGGRLLTDDVPGLREALGVDLPVWHTADDLARLARPPFDAWPDAATRHALAERVVAEHSFDARARTLLDAALAHRAS